MAAVTWVSCREALPDDEQTVLIWLTADQEAWTGFRDTGQWRYVSGDPVGVDVSHWADFPAGPGVEPLADERLNSPACAASCAGPVE